VALMAAYLLSPPGMPWTDANGDPLNGGLIYVYQAGTSTLTDSYPTYADAVARTNPNTNPVVLNATGLPSSGGSTIGIWLASGLYKIIVRNSAGVLIQTQDSVGDNTGTDVLPPNYLAGLDLGINALDPANDIDIAAGAARDAADSEDMTLASALVKQTNAAWAVGTNAGGLDTGSLSANTQYYVWLIKRTDTGVVDVLFSTSNSSPTMPTNYDKKRRHRLVQDWRHGGDRPGDAVLGGRVDAEQPDDDPPDGLAGTAGDHADHHGGGAGGVDFEQLLQRGLPGAGNPHLRGGADDGFH
jgi:hypothetical protein